MKKIKINEQQANMLKDLGKTKVLKITQEQYNRILETERLVEMDLSNPITREFSKNMSNTAKKEFTNTKVQGISELYEKFINELYGMSEDTEKKYEKLSKLMEVAGLISNGRLVKEKFQGNKNIVREVISAALDEMSDSGNEYKAMEIMEEALDLSKDYKDGDDLFKAKMDSIISKVRDNRVRFLYQKALNGEGKFVEAWRAYRNSGESGLQEGEKPNGITGMDIVKYPPMSQLRKTRGDKQTEVRRVTIPSLDRLDGQRVISSKQEMVTYSFTSSVGKKIVMTGYINEFKNKFGEEPIFKATPEDNFLDFDILNPKFVEARDKFTNGMANAIANDPGLSEEEVDETTVAGSSGMGGSSGPFVGGLTNTNPDNQPNVADELINDNIDVTDNILGNVVKGLLTIIDRPSLDPNVIINNQKELLQIASSIEGYDDSEDNVINKTLPLIKKNLPTMIGNLIKYADDSMLGITPEYVQHVKGVYDILTFIKRNGGIMEDEIYETTTAGSVGGQYATPGFLPSEFMGNAGKKGKAPVKTSVKPYMKGAKEVKIKDKCSKFPYCNQGPDAIAESIAKETGRTVEEVKQIIENFKVK